MKHTFILLVVCLVSLNTFGANKEKEVFANFKNKTFTFEGHQAHIVFPKVVEKSHSWVWRARFWGHEPQVDIALLNAGFHVVYVDVSNMFGCDSAVTLWNHFYDYCTDEYHLNPKVALEGMSRGGLIVYNWASSNTEKVSTIYADAPVADIKSWPAGMYEGEGSPKAWKKCLQAYNLDSVSVMKYKNLPVYNCKKVAKAGIPVIHVCGADDAVVPYVENTARIKEVFDRYDTEMKVIIKKGVGHHPHCLEDPSEITQFLLKNNNSK